MSPEKQREIASKGGRAAHEKGTAHEWTADEARNAGRKGGQVSRGGRGRLITAPEVMAAPTAPAPPHDPLVQGRLQGREAPDRAEHVPPTDYDTGVDRPGE